MSLQGQPARGRPADNRQKKSARALHASMHQLRCNDRGSEYSGQVHAPLCALASPSVPASSSALALGASILELSPQHPTFGLCKQLLHRQPLCEGNVTLSVLRVLQCHGHYVDVQHTDVLGLPPYTSTASASANSRGATVPRLAFVTGDLAALSTFIRSGLRLLDPNPSLRKEQLIQAGLNLSGQLTVDAGWGRRGAPEARARRTPIPGTSLLRIWRLVLAVCWPAGRDGLDYAALPAFIIDYAAEERAAQLDFGLA